MTAAAAKPFGVDIRFLTPESFRTVALPGYPGIRVALPAPTRIAALIAEANPDSIHIATEGPIGLLVRRYCRKHARPFTTSFHTRFPDYISARAPIPEAWIWAALRWFHSASRAVMAATPALADELRQRGFRNVVLWPRGRRHRLVSSAGDRSPPAAPDFSVGRTHCGREKYRCVSQPRSTRRQGCRRRWTGSRNARADLSGRGLSRRTSRRTTGSEHMPPPTSSCSRAAPIRSASFFSKRWRAAFRSRPSLWPARAMSSVILPSASSTRIYDRRPWRR